MDVLSDKTRIPMERKEAMLMLVKEKRFCSIEELIQKFGVSKVTVHRMLNELENDRLVVKVRGGVRFQEAAGVETKFSIRLKNNNEQKLEIAQKALTLIEDGDSIFLESSSTCLYLAAQIGRSHFSDLTIITNGPAIGDELSNYPGIHVIMTGGEYHAELNTLGGPLTLYAIEKLQFKKVFLSALAISPKGIMTSISLLLDIKRKLMEGDREFNLLIDSSKFAGIAPHMIMPATQLKRIITDHRLSPDLVKTYEDLGVEVLI